MLMLFALPSRSLMTRLPLTTVVMCFPRRRRSSTRGQSSFGFNVNDYDRYIQVYSTFEGCQWEGLGLISGRASWINGKVREPPCAVAGRLRPRRAAGCLDRFLARRVNRGFAKARSFVVV